MTDYNKEYFFYLQRRVHANVYANASQLMIQLYNGATTDEDFADVMYTYDSTYTDDGGEPELVEALQHWIVSPFLGGKLKEQGEMVGNVHGLTIWGRTTCGQTIEMDHVFKRCFPVSL
jgi:hypothetical protein